MKCAFCREYAIGEVTVVEEDGFLVDVGAGRNLPPDAVLEDTPLLREADRQLSEYFAGERRAFDLPLRAKGTAFQKKVWQALTEIPYGETRSYKQIAEAVGSPRAFRAVGMANHCNPIGIVVPCHRVVGSDGTLTGYAGGLPVKQKLLALERGLP